MTLDQVFDADDEAKRNNPTIYNPDVNLSKIG
jgi:hypothetical protein